MKMLKVRLGASGFLASLDSEQQLTKAEDYLQERCAKTKHGDPDVCLKANGSVMQLMSCYKLTPST